MVASIYINGVIDQFGGSFMEDTTSLEDVRRQFNSFSGPTSITAYINSVGGDVDEGFAIKDFLRAQNIPVTTIVEGKAFSIATVVMLAGDREKRFVRPGASGLVHNPFPAIPTFGDANEHERAVNELRALEDRIATLYESETNLTFEEAKALMSEDRRIDANEMVSMGFASSVQESLKAVAIYKPKTEDMSNNSEELKGLRKSIDDLRNFFKNQEQPKPEPKKEEEEEQKPEDKTPELEAKIKDLEAQLVAANTKNEEAGKQNEELNKQVSTQTEQISQFQNLAKQLQERVTKLEDLPLAINQDKETFHAKKESNRPPEMTERFEKMAAAIRNN